MGNTFRKHHVHKDEGDETANVCFILWVYDVYIGNIVIYSILIVVKRYIYINRSSSKVLKVNHILRFLKRVNCRQLIGFKENRFTQVVVVVMFHSNILQLFIRKSGGKRL